MRFNRRSRGGVLLRALVWAASGLLLLAVIALVGLDVFLRGKYQPVLDTVAEDVTTNVDLFCEEQAKLAADPWFQEPRTEGDAGPLLNAWLGWDPGPKMPEDSPLRVPAHLPQSAKDFNGWLTSDVDLSGLDFSWMARLHAFDRWDTMTHRPVPHEQPFNMMTASVPNFIPLQLWAKFRLRHGMKTGNTAEASRDVRQMAWLAYRTDTLLGAMIATALLGMERKAHDAMASPPADWRPMSEAQTDRMRAVFWASMVFSSIAAPPGVSQKARACGQAITRCVGLSEAASMARYLKPFAERSYRQAYAALGQDIAGAPCPTSLVQTLWEHGATLDDPPSPGSSMPDQPEWMRRLPRAYSGRHISGILLALGIQDISLLKKLRAGEAPPATADAAP
jgi:hypothetical protein